MKTKDLIIGTLAVLIIAASAVWTYRTQFAAPDMNAELQRIIGDRLAAEAHRVAGGKGKAVAVTLEPGTSSALDEQWRSFESRLQTLGGLRLDDVERVDADKGDKYGPGAGLSARRLNRLMEKHRDQDILISFIGLPDLEEKEAAALGKTRPKLVAFARSTKGVREALRLGVAQAVIVPRYQFPAPGDADPKSAAGWFDLRFQIVTAETAGVAKP